MQESEQTDPIAEARAKDWQEMGLADRMRFLEQKKDGTAESGESEFLTRGGAAAARSAGMTTELGAQIDRSRKMHKGKDIGKAAREKDKKKPEDINIGSSAGLRTWRYSRSAGGF